MKSFNLHTLGLRALIVYSFVCGVALSALSFSAATLHQLESKPTDPVIRLQSTNLRDLHHRFGKPSRVGHNVAIWRAPSGTSLDTMLVAYEPGSKRIVGYRFSRKSAFGTLITSTGDLPTI